MTVRCPECGCDELHHMTSYDINDEPYPYYVCPVCSAAWDEDEVLADEPARKEQS